VDKIMIEYVDWIPIVNSRKNAEFKDKKSKICMQR